MTRDLSKEQMKEQTVEDICGRFAAPPESGSAESSRKGRERRTDRGKRRNTPRSVLKPQPEKTVSGKSHQFRTEG